MLGVGKLAGHLPWLSSSRTTGASCCAFSAFLSPRGCCAFPFGRGATFWGLGLGQRLVPGWGKEETWRCPQGTRGWPLLRIRRPLRAGCWGSCGELICLVPLFLVSGLMMIKGGGVLLPSLSGLEGESLHNSRLRGVFLSLGG